MMSRRPRRIRRASPSLSSDCDHHCTNPIQNLSRRSMRKRIRKNARHAATAAAGPAALVNGANPTAPSLQAPGVYLLGSEENGMTVIQPPRRQEVNGTCAIEMIRRVDQELRTKRVLELFHELCNVGDQSVRKIQSGRWEVFLDAGPEKGSHAFDMAMSTSTDDSLKNAKDVIISYAIGQARRDPRINCHRENEEYEFQNFALIINSDPVTAQVPHIDLVRPSFQFGMLLTDGALGTLFHEVDEDEGLSLRTADDLVQLWSDHTRGGGDGTREEFPRALSKEIRGDADIREKMESFGKVLAPRSSFRMRAPALENSPGLEAGTVLSLPGGVVHAGPEYARHRGVLFFSGRPEGCGSTYNPDTQYFGPLLVGEFISILWERPGIGYKERLFLLKRLVHHIEDKDPSVTVWKHFSQDDCFRKFVALIEDNPRMGRREKDKLLKSTAKNEKLFCPSDDPRNVGLQDAVQASVDGLAIYWGDGFYYRAVVYWRSGSPSAAGVKGDVALCYPGNGDVEWEGTGEADPYTLTMDTEDELFDSSNGTLRDSDGEEIMCCIMSTKVDSVKLPSIA